MSMVDTNGSCLFWWTHNPKLVSLVWSWRPLGT